MKRITPFSIILMSWKFTLNTLVRTLVMIFNVYYTFLKGWSVHVTVYNRRWGGEGGGGILTLWACPLSNTRWWVECTTIEVGKEKGGEYVC